MDRFNPMPLPTLAFIFTLVCRKVGLYFDDSPDLDSFRSNIVLMNGMMVFKHLFLSVKV